MRDEILIGPRWWLVLSCSAVVVLEPLTSAQVVISGRLQGARFPGSSETIPYSAVVCFANLDGSDSEARSFRTWETQPAGWYRLSGGAGNYTMSFTQPGQFVRPMVRFNVFTRAGDRLDGFNLSPGFDCFCFDERGWDRQPASEYDQCFVASGTSVTGVGFRLANDGVDGAGPGGQDLLVSIHRRGPGTPNTWPQIGAAVRVPEVDCGGPKNRIWSAGWNSGEVPLIRGEAYAVRLRAEKPGGTFQAFWHTNADPAKDCFRVGGGQAGYEHRQLWLGISTDGDGLVIPYNKRVHRQYGQFAGFASKWSQTYVARGRSLAAVVLYAAVGGAQPPLSRQRCVVRMRRGGAGGPRIGVEKIAIGNGNYTGDASWGMFGAAFAPGEAPLTPGETYAVEFESLESYETLHGWTNIKGQLSDDRPGFNPYRKDAHDSYDTGTAFKNGRDPMDFDLDLQIIEYEDLSAPMAGRLEAADLLVNGNASAGAGDTGNGHIPRAWRKFALDPGTVHEWASEGPANTNRFLRVSGGGAKIKAGNGWGYQPGKTVDGGFVQRIADLSRFDTYVLSGRVRCSWPLDDAHQLLVGVDPSGQDQDGSANTVVWTPLPPRHGQWIAYQGEPIRPAANAISVWLRGRTTQTFEPPFHADFDDFTLHRVQTQAKPRVASPADK